MRIASLTCTWLLAALLAQGAAAQCAEPSALDLDPGATPLRVEKAGGGSLRISWEPVLADAQRLHRGTLDRLALAGEYDHRVVLEVPTAEALVDSGDGNAYFLVNSSCRAGDSGVGRDSEGRERPWGGLLQVNVGLQGGTGVYGVQFNLNYPEDRAFTAAEDAVFVGPFANGAPGSPFGIVNAGMPGIVRMAVIFGSFSPDPSFDPPPAMPVDVAEVVFGYHGAPPPAGDFTVDGCMASDMLGNPIPETICVVSGYSVLF